VTITQDSRIVVVLDINASTPYSDKNQELPRSEEGYYHDYIKYSKKEKVSKYFLTKNALNKFL
jgi:hypothetical protein